MSHLTIRVRACGEQEAIGSSSSFQHHGAGAQLGFAADHRAVPNAVGLRGASQLMPSELSGGMRKRAGLARALVLEPRILLADEPSSGLDRITAGEIDELMLEQKAQHQTTLIIVTHDVHGAKRVGDRIAVFDKGRLIAHGTAAEVGVSEHEVARKLISEQ